MYVCVIFYLVISCHHSTISLSNLEEGLFFLQCNRIFGGGYGARNKGSLLITIEYWGLNLYFKSPKSIYWETQPLGSIWINNVCKIKLWNCSKPSAGYIFSLFKHYFSSKWKQNMGSENISNKNIFESKVCGLNEIEVILT